MITNGPWNSFPGNMMQNLKRFGLGIQCTSLAHLSIASKARNGMSTQSNFDSVRQYYDQTWASEERTLDPLGPSWVQDFCFFAIARAIDAAKNANTKRSKGEKKLFVQKNIMKDLLQTNTYSPEAFLVHRLSRFFIDDAYHSKVTGLVQNYLILGKRYKLCFLTAHLRLTCNQWCSSRRFGRPAQQCPFCSSDGIDELEHVLVCEHFQQCLMGARRIPLCSIILLDSRDNPNEFSFFYSYVAFHAYNMCRHGKRLSRRLLCSIFKRASLHCSRMRWNILNWRASGLCCC